MRPLERVPAVRRIDTDRSDLFAVEITGEFTAADAENLFGLLEGAYVLHDRIDVLVRMRALDEVEIADVDSATVDDMRDHVARHVGRCAVIDDGGRAGRIERLLAPGESTETRHFSLERESEAWEWLGAREALQAR